METEPRPPVRDRLREDVARLLGVPPRSIGDDDDLTEHGLDSIRMMSLANDWRANEAGVSFADLVETPTITAWVTALAEDDGGAGPALRGSG
ncbi:phosphopantetheine-binding protein [Sphaerisporangium dianthi]|uniref:Phosphopantetheine-binding protein n=1 Tax=Sphaerisporangium dianthi TaxID=1436120 RepID=A0ABV9CTV9_9ACTN